MSEWEQKPLGKFIFFQRGHDLARSEMKQGNIPVAGSNGIIGYHERPTTKAPGLTIGRSGNIGTPRFYKEDFWAHNTVLYVKNFYGNDPLFSYYLLMNIDFSGFNSGSAVPSLNRNHIHEHLIRTPSLAEQKAIASVLASIDDKIDLLHRQNKTLGSMAEALFKQWFIEGLEDKVTYSALGQLIKLQSGYAFKSKDFTDAGVYRVIKIKNISGNVVDIKETDFLNAKVGDVVAERFHLKTGQVLIAMTGAEIGKLGLIPKNKEKMLLNQRVGLITPQFHGAEYLAYLYLNSEIGQDYIQNAATGSAQPNISTSQIQSCPFPEINIELLKHHAKEIKIYFDKIVDNLGSMETLEKLRDTLLPKLMSGEVRVEYAEKAIASVA